MRRIGLIALVAMALSAGCDGETVVDAGPDGGRPDAGGGDAGGDDAGMEVRLDEVTHSAEATRALGIQVGDFVAFDPRVEVGPAGYIRSRHLDDKASVAAVFGALQSQFLLLPRGPGFVPYPDFEQAYQVLKRHTGGFAAIEPNRVMAALHEDALAFVVLRTILGFTPPELADTASEIREIKHAYRKQIEPQPGIDY